MTPKTPIATAKTGTGIAGLDAAMHGGLPAGHATLVTGPAGSGKTMLAMQVLLQGAAQGESGVCVTFEEPPETLRANSAAIPGAEEGFARIGFIDVGASLADMERGQFEISGLISAIAAKCAEMGARRLVLDGLDHLLGLLTDPHTVRRELYRLYRWILDQGLTTLLTAKLGDHGSGAVSPEGLDYICDCVLRLEHRLVDGIATRALYVAKYRGSDCVQHELPFVITRAGVQVAHARLPDIHVPSGGGRISSGVPRLDAMLNGGYQRGSTVLITGTPGTAKTTLAAAFAEAACARGERTLFVSFDEDSDWVIRNMRSVNIELGRFVQDGSLQIQGYRARSRSLEHHFVAVTNAFEALDPGVVVLDTITALVKTGQADAASDTVTRLLETAKARRKTLLLTSLVPHTKVNSEAASLHISTIADTWLHLDNLEQSGERNRALSVVKSRGTAHSKQVRELILSDRGIDLADVYLAGGEVLMGTARLERETLDDWEEHTRRQEQALHLQQLEHRLQRSENERQALQDEIDLLRQELETRKTRESARRAARDRVRARVHAARGGDPDGDS